MKRTLIAYFTMVAGFLGLGTAYHYDVLPELPDMRHWKTVDHWSGDNSEPVCLNNAYNRPFPLTSADGVRLHLRFKFDWHWEYAKEWSHRIETEVALRSSFYLCMKSKVRNTSAIDVPQQIDKAIAAWRNAQKMGGIEFREFEHQVIFPQEFVEALRQKTAMKVAAEHFTTEVLATPEGRSEFMSSSERVSKCADDFLIGTKEYTNCISAAF